MKNDSLIKSLIRKISIRGSLLFELVSITSKASFKEFAKHDVTEEDLDRYLECYYKEKNKNTSLSESPITTVGINKCSEEEWI